MKIFVVSCIHGDEKFGLKVLSQLITHGHPDIVTRIAHPEAVAKGTRFLETDLNRSFMLQPSDSREARIAEHIKAEIEALQPDLILDLHTSTVKVDKVAILAENNPELTNAAKLLGMNYAAVMPEQIASQSLIGVHPSKSMCIELGKNLRSDKLAIELAERICMLADSAPSSSDAQLPLLHIERLISRDEANGLKLENYVFNEQLAGTPFLTGENNYVEHRGFLATRLSEV